MNNQIKSHVKNMIKFIALLLVFYIFVHCMITITMMITFRSYDLPILLNLLAHVITSLIIVLTIYAYDPGRDRNDKIDIR